MKSVFKTSLRGETMRPADIHETVKQLNIKASADLDCRVHGDIDQALAEHQQTQVIPLNQPARRQLMKNPMIKLAAMVIIVVAVILGFNPFDKSTVTFAQVIRPLLNARNVALDFITGDEDTAIVIHDIMVGNRIRRTVPNLDTTMIIDLDSNRMLNLDSKTKTGSVINIEGTMAYGTRQCMDLVRNIVAAVEKNPDLVVKDLGRKDFDEVEAIGFQVKESDVTISIWADPITATPKRIELAVGSNVSIFKNIEFDVFVTEDEMSMDVPEGYTLSKQPMDLGEPTEEDLIFMLDVMANDLADGVFPDQLDVQTLMALLPKLEEAQSQMALSEEAKAQGGMHYARCMMFLSLNMQKRDFHYAGQGVAFGDSNTAIVWYRPDDSKTYRVIYGDLHVEEVSLDRLPQ
jgi:outer membrane lipoprotein-sorting protein